MLFKNGNKEFQLGGAGDVFLGTLVIGAVTFLSGRIVNVIEKLAEREDLPELIDKSKNIVKLDEFRPKAKWKK